MRGSVTGQCEKVNELDVLRVVLYKVACLIDKRMDDPSWGKVEPNLDSACSAFDNSDQLISSYNHSPCQPCDFDNSEL
jgi:hypothetical protein